MSTLSLLPTTTAVPRSNFEFPVLTILGGHDIPQEDWFTLKPDRDRAGDIVGWHLLLPAGMPASVQLDKIEAAVAELRKHIAPDGSLLRDRIPSEAPRTPQLTLVPTQRQGSER